MGNRKDLALSVSFMGGNRTFMYKNSVSQIYCRKGGFPLVFLPFIFGNLPAVFSHRCANPLSARIYRRTHLLYFSFFISFRLTVGSKKCEVLFYPAFFMLMLFVVLYCSLTPFPMHNYLFMDRTTGLYGIIPENFDKGAVYLDSFFSLNYS